MCEWYETARSKASNNVTQYRNLDAAYWMGRANTNAIELAQLIAVGGAKWRIEQLRTFVAEYFLSARMQQKMLPLANKKFF